jgi:hypothetical protein
MRRESLKLDLEQRILRCVVDQSAPIMPIAAGTRIDRLEIVALIGRGGMGEVYRARDTVLQRSVAIKFLTGLNELSGLPSWNKCP